MKEAKLEKENGRSKIKTVPLPPPALLQPKFWAQRTAIESVTKQEVAKFWRQKLIEEEDHLLAAFKAAAHMRGYDLSEDGYKQFKESVKDDDENTENIISNTAKDANKNEVRVGIKDWWTKSKYAYLNQAAVESNEGPKRRISSYIPSDISFKSASPLYPSCMGV